MDDSLDIGPVHVSGGPFSDRIKNARVIHRNSRLYVFVTRSGNPRRRTLTKVGLHSSVAAVFDAPEPPTSVGGVQSFGDLSFAAAGCKCQYGRVGLESSDVLVRDADNAIAAGELELSSAAVAEPVVA
jgi:hypothetical protein